MSQFPEDLEMIICRLCDEGWTEKNYVYFDGMFEVNMVKDNKKIRIEYEDTDEQVERKNFISIRRKP